MREFEYNCILNRYYDGKETPSKEILEHLGNFALDFTNINSLGTQLPYIHENSSRLSTIWAENPSSDEIVLVFRGHYVLIPYDFSKEELGNFYSEHLD